MSRRSSVTEWAGKTYSKVDPLRFTRPSRTPTASGCSKEFMASGPSPFTSDTLTPESAFVAERRAFFEQPAIDAAAEVFDEIAEDLSIDAADLSGQINADLCHATPPPFPTLEESLRLHIGEKPTATRGCFRRDGANIGQAPETCQPLHASCPDPELTRYILASTENLPNPQVTASPPLDLHTRTVACC